MNRPSTALRATRQAARQAARRAALVAALSVTGLAATAVVSAAQERLEHNVMVPMRDGVRLATDIYLPAGDGPFSAIVQRTPYSKGSSRGQSYTERGYVLVVQDQRGRFDSEGTYIPHEHEVEDGYDTVEWIAAQPWSNGKVGISGGSALGIAANLAATSRPPHLVAAYVTVAPESLFFEGRFIGGLFKEADTGNWMRGQGVSEEAIAAYKKRVVLDERWEEKDFIFLRPDVEIPIYNVGGWYDLFLKGTIDNFRYLQEWGRPGARGNQKVRVGPFGHGQVRGDLEYPDPFDRRSVEEQLRWFDYWLEGIDNGIMDEPPVSYYMRASARKGDASPKNGWRTAEQWPPLGSTPKRLYLQPGRGLGWGTPPDDTAPTRYRFDPAEPVPTVGGLNLTLPLGPMDQRKIPERGDYLRFESAVLEEDLVLAGKLDAELWAATDGPDTDFIVKLVDVYPDGYEALILDSGVRTRYRLGRRSQDVVFMEPGLAERLEIDLWHTAITIEKGHKLAVHVTSSNHPRFEVNPNTGSPPGEPTTPRVATNTIYHDAEHPSAIVLPILAQE